MFKVIHWYKNYIFHLIRFEVQPQVKKDIEANVPATSITRGHTNHNVVANCQKEIFNCRFKTEGLWFLISYNILLRPKNFEKIFNFVLTLLRGKFSNLYPFQNKFNKIELKKGWISWFKQIKSSQNPIQKHRISIRRNAYLLAKIILRLADMA